MPRCNGRGERVTAFLSASLRTECQPLRRGPQNHWASSRTPVERMEGAGIALPLPQLGVRPPAPLTARQLHPLALQRRLRCAPLHRRWLARLVLQGLQRHLAHVPDGNGQCGPPLDRNPCGLRWQPLRDDGTEQGLQEPALSTTEDRLQLPALLRTGRRIEIEAGCPVALPEVSRPVRRKNNLGAAQVDAIGVALLDVEHPGTRAPALVGLCRTQPAGTQYLATTELDPVARHVPCHEPFLPFASLSCFAHVIIATAQWLGVVCLPAPPQTWLVLLLCGAVVLSLQVISL